MNTEKRSKWYYLTQPGPTTPNDPESSPAPSAITNLLLIPFLGGAFGTLGTLGIKKGIELGQNLAHPGIDLGVGIGFAALALITTASLALDARQAYKYARANS